MVNVDEMVAGAKAAYRAGRPSEARASLLEAVRRDPNHQDAWLWLSGLVETLEEQRACLENVLALNPNHERARKGLEAIEQQIAARGTPPASPPGNAQAPPPGWGTPATSVEWGREGGTAVYGSGKQLEGPSHEEYDKWVSELHLGVEDAPPAATPPFMADTPSGPFGDTTYMFDPQPFLDDTLQGAQPADPAPDDPWARFSPGAGRPGPAGAPAHSVDDNEPAHIWPAPEPASVPPPSRVSRRTQHEFSFDEDEDEPDIAAAPAFRFPDPPPAMPPPPPRPAPPEPQRPAQRTGPGSDGYFAYIPAEITADTAQRRSRVLAVALVVLIVANLAAAAALLSAL